MEPNEKPIESPLTQLWSKLNVALNTPGTLPSNIIALKNKIIEIIKDNPHTVIEYEGNSYLATAKDGIRFVAFNSHFRTEILHIWLKNKETGNIRPSYLDPRTETVTFSTVEAV